MAALYSIDTSGFNLNGFQPSDIRIAFLVFFVIGFAISLVTLVLGIFDYLGPRVWVN